MNLYVDEIEPQSTRVDGRHACIRLMLLAVAALAAVRLSAQAPPFPIPEYDNVFYRYDPLQTS
jgi:hypothetical protein